METFFEIRPQHLPGSPQVKHPDSLPTMDIVYLEEKWTAKRAIEILKHYSISSEPVINSNQCLFLGFQSIWDFLVLFFDHVLVSQHTRHEICTKLREILNHPSESADETLFPRMTVDSSIEELKLHLF